MSSGPCVCMACGVACFRGSHVADALVKVVQVGIGGNACDFKNHCELNTKQSKAIRPLKAPAPAADGTRTIFREVQT